jgi:methyl-accepting chemotaxis protein
MPAADSEPRDGDPPGAGGGGVRDRIRGSYARKFLLALLVVVVAVAAVGVVVQATLADALRADVNEKLVAQADAEARGLAEFMASHRVATFTTSNHPAVGGDDADALRAFLAARQADALPETVAALHVVGVDEKTAVASTADAVAPGDSFAAYTWASTLSFSDFDDVTASDPYTNRQGERVIAFLSTVEAAPSRVLVVAVDVADVAEELSTAIDGGFTRVVDSGGRVVFADRAAALGDPYLDGGGTPTVLAASRDRDAGFLADTRREQSLDGDYVTAYAGVDGTDWVLVKHAPAANAYHLATLVTRGVVGIVVVALVGVAAIGVTVGRKTSRDLTALARAAEAAAAGDYGVELTRERRDELGALTAAVASMRDSLVDRIREAESAEAELARKNETVEEQRAVISVLNRVLRHNLRNSGNVILGHLDSLARDPPPEAAAEHRERVEAHVTDLLEKAEKAHHVEELVVGGDDALTTVDVSAVLASELDAAAAVNPDATVAAAVDEGVSALAHGTVAVVVENLVENAIEHSDRDEPWVRGSVSRVTRDGEPWVAVEVADDGPGIPASELEALDEGVETAMQHASGIGLWLADWLVSAMGGDLVFADRTPRGTVATVYLRAVDSAVGDATGGTAAAGEGGDPNG